jgi:diadenosine tetraphosphate (Ap4A) HIT family hydrolase
MTNCRLCFNSLQTGPAETWNRPLFESANFVVLPSLGALVEGWLLLVPKKHSICLGALQGSVDAEMHQFKHFLFAELQRQYGQVCAFEHGPARANLSIGCGVDHAHLHIVPVAFDLASAVKSFLPKDASWSKAGLGECRDAFRRGQDYLYLEQPVGLGRIATHQQIGSQLFRRAIATRIGMPEQFNWREYPQVSNVSATINRLQLHDGSVFSCMNRREAAA